LETTFSVPSRVTDDLAITLCTRLINGYIDLLGVPLLPAVRHSLSQTVGFEEDGSIVLVGAFVVRREVYDDVFHYSPPPQEPPSEELEQSLDELEESLEKL
jgi:hypothetical protein